jgi:hypothetical protein
MPDMGIVPSAPFEDGATALRALLPDKKWLRAAVAFASLDGVALLREILGESDLELIQIVVRGAPVTDPAALPFLQEELGADVSVVCGPAAVRFHPKLWLLRGEAELDVLTGSGNLTTGGLQRNLEQFELLRVTAEPEIAAHEERFSALTADALPLDEVVGSIAWREWIRTQKDRSRLERELRRLEQRVLESPPRDRTMDKKALLDDLWDIHDRTVAERLPKRDGGAYNPSGLRLELEGHRGVSDPVLIVGRLCRRQTDGFDTILAADRPDLTVEALVVDPDKPYHSLFPAEIRDLSRERLNQFPAWNSD